jgi:hypothetical protein
MASLVVTILPTAQVQAQVQNMAMAMASLVVNVLAVVRLESIALLGFFTLVMPVPVVHPPMPVQIRQMVDLTTPQTLVRNDIHQLILLHEE